jgi:Fic family protein
MEARMAYNFGSLRIPSFSFDNSLTDLIIDLDHLRRKRLEGTTNPRVFLQVKEILHMIETVGSARIEGNRTTVTEYIETKIGTIPSNEARFKEIVNLEEAMRFIENNTALSPINRAFVSELHKLAVAGLPLPPEGEGDSRPGRYRESPVAILRSSHKPPDYTQVGDYMEELFAFVSSEGPSKQDLLKTAIAHHRFLWIHPFGNGNGRTARLLTYAMLVKQGFRVDIGERILNPTAVFCADRNAYYDSLRAADSGEDEGILSWCRYVLKGLQAEIEKVDSLVDRDYLSREILLPALDYSRKAELITALEYEILRKSIAKDDQTIMAKDISDILPDKSPSAVSRVIGTLRDKKMLVPVEEGARRYVISFTNSYLLRGVIGELVAKGYIPDMDNP